MLFGRTTGEIGLVVFIFVLVYWGTVVPRIIRFVARKLGDTGEGPADEVRADDR